MRFQIRECEIGDAKAICELNATELGYVYSVDKTKDKIKELLKSDKDKIYVAVVNHCVVGYVHANDYDTIYMPRQDFGTTRNSQNNGAKRGNLGHLLCHETTRRLLFSRIKVGNVIVIVKRYLR